MTEKVLKLIEDISSEMKAKRQYPIVVTSIDISRRISGCHLDQVERVARTLSDRGLIRIGKTINYEYYEIIGS